MGRVLDKARELEQRNATAETTIKPAAATAIAADAMTLAANVRENRRQLLDAAETIIIGRLDEIDFSRWIGDARLYFHNDELAIFDALHWDNKKLKEECSRLLTVRRWKGEAGTAAEREAARQRLAEVKVRNEAEVDDLRNQVANLQAQIRELERTETSAAAAVAKHNRAVDELRKLVPPHVKEHHERRKAVVVPQRQRLMTIRNEISATAQLAAIDVTTLDGKRQAASGLTQNHPAYTGRLAEPIDVAAWKAFIEERQQQIPALESEGAAMAAECDDAKANADSLLDHYLQ